MNSGENVDENQPLNVNDVNQTTVTDKTVQQMTHGFVALFEKELDQVQYSLKEALYVISFGIKLQKTRLIDHVEILEQNRRKWALN